MSDQQAVKIRTALISVSNKTGLVEFCHSLVEEFKIKIISTGGTLKTLKEAKVNAIEISEFTDFPEIMDGRVKTINPLVEGGILGLRDVHSTDAEANQIQWIDLVVCNLYPFSKTNFLSNG